MVTVMCGDLGTDLYIYVFLIYLLMVDLFVASSFAVESFVSYGSFATVFNSFREQIVCLNNSKFNQN